LKRSLRKSDRAAKAITRSPYSDRGFHLDGSMGRRGPFSREGRGEIVGYAPRASLTRRSSLYFRQAFLNDPGRVHHRLAQLGVLNNSALDPRPLAEQ
jgi:hypothetical protein